jgi:hypothetical protein
VQALPQVPQFWGLLRRSTQPAPGQSVCPAGQEPPVQAPLLQYWVDWQEWPQVPQLLGLYFVSTQTPPQLVRPVVHSELCVQPPEMQT